MAVTFVIGRAGTGKTRYCLDGLKGELARAGETRRLIFLVPEQSSFQMERAVAIESPARGFWRAEVLTFTRLMRRLFAEQGLGPAALRPGARVMVLRLLAERSAPLKQAFGRSARTSGFYQHMDKCIEELLAANITPDRLATTAAAMATGPSRTRVEATASLYGAYLEWLGEERLDLAAHLVLLRERVIELPWLHDASVWVDGFAAFSGQELAILTTLARSAREVKITLLADPAAAAIRNPDAPIERLDLFGQTQQLYRELCAQLAEAEVEIDAPVFLAAAVAPRFVRASGLAGLELGLARETDETHRVGHDGSDAQSGQGAGDVRIVACANPREEVRQAARRIRTMVAESEGKLRFRDFSIIARDLAPFADLVAEVFGEYDIPHFVDRRRTVRFHPLCRMIGALVECVRTDFSTRSAERLLRTGLLPLSRGDGELLEEFVRRFAVRGASAWRKREWSFSNESWRGADEGKGVRRLPPELNLKRFEIIGAIQPLMALLGPTESSGTTGASWAGALYRSVEALGAPTRLAGWIDDARGEEDWETAEIHRLAWDAVCNCIEDIAECLGEVALGLDELEQILASALSDSTLGLAPSTLDQVLVSSIDRSRHPDVRHTWIVGFNDGIFPAHPAEDAFLSTAERQLLREAGLSKLPVHREDAFGERLLMYVACTRASESLTISFAAADEGGGPLQPSPFIEEIRSAVPGVRIEAADRAAPPACMTEFARRLLEGERERADEDVRMSRRLARLRKEVVRWERLGGESAGIGRGRVAGKLDWLLRGLNYANAPSSLGRRRRLHADETTPEWRGTPSELLTYIQCPFKHFSRYCLKLELDDGPNALPATLGSIAHHVLSESTRRAMASPGGVRGLGDEQWQSFLAESLAEIAAVRGEEAGDADARLGFMIELLKPFLAEVVAAHAERFRRGEFEPFRTEWEFGGENAAALPPLRLQTDAGDVIELRGKIDRVDRQRAGNGDVLLVYDYKSGAGRLRVQYLTGDRLQLFIYVLALRNGMSPSDGARVGGVLIAPLRPDVEMLKNGYFEKAGEAERRMFMYRPRGRFDEASALVLDLKRVGEQSPVAAIRIKKDGGLYKNCDACGAGALEDAVELARRTVVLAAEGIIEGNIQIAPLSENCELACNRCEFKPLCRFERGQNEIRDAARTLPRLEQGDDE